MLFTNYTWVMSILWFTFGGLLLHILVRKGKFVLHHGVKILLLLVLLFAIRLITPFEIVNAFVVKDRQIYPVLQSYWKFPLPWIHPDFTVGYMLLSLWAIGTTLCLIRLFVQVSKDCKTIRQLRQASRPTSKLLDHFHQIIPTKNCYLAVSPLVKTPMVVGFFTPTILLPETVSRLSPTTWTHIFQHEWQHTKSKDIWVKLLLKTLCCLLWWNPVTYLLDKNLGHMLELQCDTEVTKSMDKEEKSQYLQSILQIVDTMDDSSKNVAVASCYTGISEEFALRQRFGTVLYNSAPKKVGATVLTIAMCLLFFLSYTVTLQPSGMPTEEDAEGIIIATAENSYIYVTKEGERQFFLNDEFWHTVSSDLMKAAPYCDLPMIYE